MGSIAQKWLRPPDISLFNLTHPDPAALSDQDIFYSCSKPPARSHLQGSLTCPEPAAPPQNAAAAPLPQPGP